MEVSIIIFGLQESKNDINQVRRLLEDDIDSVIHIRRIGKSLKSGTKQAPRPIKVELKCAEDKNWVLHNSRMLINTFGDNNIRIARCLSTAELDKLKNLRCECSRLNTSSATVANGKNKIVVINPRTMERLQNGTLISFTLPSTGGIANASKVLSYSSNITSGNG